MPAILSEQNLLAPGVWSASSTGIEVPGYPASNVLGARIDQSWMAPSGGSQTLTLTRSAGRTDLNVVCIASPAGQPMLGDITLRLRNHLGNLVYLEVLPAYAFPGLPDRRFAYISGFGAPTKYVEIVAAAGSQIGRVFVGGRCDLSEYVETNWTLSPESLGRVQLNQGYGTTWSERNVETVPRRAKRWSGRLRSMPIFYMTDDVRRSFLINGMSGEIVWLPRAATQADSSGLREMMHRTAIYGRFSKPLLMRSAGTRTFDTAELSGDHRTYDVDMEFLDFF